MTKFLDNEGLKTVLTKVKSKISYETSSRNVVKNKAWDYYGSTDDVFIDTNDEIYLRGHGSYSESFVSLQDNVDICGYKNIDFYLKKDNNTYISYGEIYGVDIYGVNPVLELTYNSSGRHIYANVPTTIMGEFKVNTDKDTQLFDLTYDTMTLKNNYIAKYPLTIKGVSSQDDKAEIKLRATSYNNVTLNSDGTNKIVGQTTFKVGDNNIMSIRSSSIGMYGDVYMSTDSNNNYIHFLDTDGLTIYRKGNEIQVNDNSILMYTDNNTSFAKFLADSSTVKLAASTTNNITVGASQNKIVGDTIVKDGYLTFQDSTNSINDATVLAWMHNNVSEDFSKAHIIALDGTVVTAVVTYKSVAIPPSYVIKNSLGSILALLSITDTEHYAGVFTFDYGDDSEFESYSVETFYAPYDGYASKSSTGCVKIGDNITVSSIGVISLTSENIINALGYTPGSNSVDTTINYYHTNGGWSGLTLTLTGQGGASDIQATIPTGTSSDTVALGSHTHHDLTWAGNYALRASDSSSCSKTEGLRQESGVWIDGLYENGTDPCNYGNVLNVVGQGSTQLVMQWTETDDSGHLYYRSHRDMETNRWGAWNIIWDTSNYTTWKGTSDTFGVVKVGDNITSTEGVLSLTSSNVTSALGFTPTADTSISSSTISSICDQYLEVTV